MTEKVHIIGGYAIKQTEKLRTSGQPFLKKKLAPLKLNPNPKKWWQSIRQLSGYPSKKVLSTLVVGNQVVSGKTPTSYPGSLPTPGAAEKTLVGAGHVNPQILGVNRISAFLLLREE